MTYDNTRILDSRKPVSVTELYLDSCSLTYGTSPCTASTAKENLLTYSEQFDHANWSKTNIFSVTANSTTAPDGTLTAEKIVASSSTASAHYLLQSSGVATASNHAASCYFKAGVESKVVLRVQALFPSRCDVFVDLSLGQITSTAISGFTDFTSSIESVGNGWYRISAFFKSDGTAAAKLVLLTRDGSAYAGNDSDELYFWGAQFVTGNEVNGMYYKTEAAALTGKKGTECYNTYKTCQDAPNYANEQKTYRFYSPVSNWPVGQTGYPCSKREPKFTPCQIDPKGTLGKRGVVSVNFNDFSDDDIFTDKYVKSRNYNPEDQGTFFGKLKARSPYYKGRLMKVRQGYINSPFSFNDFQDRLYVIESLDVDVNGQVTVKGKDVLKLTDDKRSLAPNVSTGTLSAAITSTVTTLTLQSGEGSDYDTSGYIRIGDEAIQYTGISTDSLTGLIRGVNGSKANSHSDKDVVQQCLSYSGVNVVDIIHSLLKDYAGITENYLPYDAGLATPTGTNDVWDNEKSDWLGSNNLTHLITKPVGVKTLIENICKQNLIYMWFDEREQEIKLRAISPQIKNEIPPILTDTSNIIKKTIRVKDNQRGRISQIWVYYDIVDIVEDRDKAENYKKLYVQVDTDSENSNAYADKSIKIIYADWLSSANAGLIITLAGRLLSRYANAPKIATFKIDTKDADIWTGNLALLNSLGFQGNDGSNLEQRIQVLKITDNHADQTLTVEGETWPYSGNQYGFVTPDSMLDYTAESDANKLQYGFISENTGLMSTGDQGYLIA